jgi:hypothetical protein
MTALLLALIEQGSLKFVYGTNPRFGIPSRKAPHFYTKRGRLCVKQAIRTCLRPLRVSQREKNFNTRISEIAALV